MLNAIYEQGEHKSLFADFGKNVLPGLDNDQRNMQYIQQVLRHDKFRYYFSNVENDGTLGWRGGQDVKELQSKSFSETNSQVRAPVKPLTSIRVPKKKMRIRANKKARRKARAKTSAAKAARVLRVRTCICLACTGVGTQSNSLGIDDAKCRRCTEYDFNHAPVCCKRFNHLDTEDGVVLTELEHKLLAPYLSKMNEIRVYNKAIHDRLHTKRASTYDSSTDNLPKQDPTVRLLRDGLLIGTERLGISSLM